jgi:hypothetical protein
MYSLFREKSLFSWSHKWNRLIIFPCSVKYLLTQSVGTTTCQAPEMQILFVLNEWFTIFMNKFIVTPVAGGGGGPSL